MRRFEMTAEIRVRHLRVNQLKEALPDVMRPGRWYERCYSMRERVEFMNELSDARTNLFLEVERAYPMLKGRSYAVHDLDLSCETLEEPPSVAAVDPAATDKVERSTRV